MRLFIESLMRVLKDLGMSQTELVDRCNEGGAARGLAISKGAISNYKKGRFPEYAYAALIIRNVTDDVSLQNELATVYLRDVADELGVEPGELDIVNMRAKKVKTLHTLPAPLREQLEMLGQACVQVDEYRAVVDTLSRLSDREMNDPVKKTPRRGMKKKRKKS